MNNNGKEKYKQLRQIGLLTTIPFVLVVAPSLGFFIGDYIDRRFKTAPWFMIIFLILGSVGGVRETIILIKKASDKDER